MPRSYQPTAAGISLLAPYWTSIVGARQQGYTRAETWGLIQEAFQEGGPSFQGATIFDMNHFWSAAGNILNAETEFLNSPAVDPITADIWAWAPWAVPNATSWQVPNHMINYAYSALDAEGNTLLDTEGNPIPVWGATDWTGPLDLSVGDLTDYIRQSAQSALDVGSAGAQRQMAGIGGVGIGDFTSVQILRF
jgi:hypothetical protein